MKRNIVELLKLPETWRIPFFGGKWYRWMMKLDNDIILKERLPDRPLNDEPRTKKVIVSLTSFPARIGYVHLAIKSLLLQTYRPDRIILWLADNQFPDRKLPEELYELQKCGLEIRYCEYDLFGHKKYYQSLIEQKENEIVVTYDDDIIYPPNSLKMLIKQHEKFPQSIICNRAQAYIKSADGEVINPGKWKTITSEGVRSPSFKLCPSTGGGCLYPYNALYHDAIDKDRIIKYALKGDDLWIMFMALQQGTSFVKTRKYHKTFTVVRESQSEQLAISNIIEDGYMKIFEELKKHYPEAYQRIITDK